ncbi:MAG: hypothetical protein ACKVOJ_04310 [Sphingomonadaceae bacterium]
MMSTLERIIAQAEFMSGTKNVNAKSAIDQDIGMSGDDVTHFAEWLSTEFGDDVWHWPWQRYAELSEGLSLLFPFMFFWQLISWPFRGAFSYPSPYERLELGHIAAVIEKGEWF